MGESTPIRLSTLAFVGVAALFSALFAFAAVTRHHHLNSRLLDLALEHQVVWNTSEGRWFESSVEVAHYLGDHVSLNIAPIALLYRIAPSVEWLLIMQVMALGGSAVLLYLLARRISGDARQAFLVGLAFLLHPACALQSINDFHPNVFALPCIFGALLAAEGRRWIFSSLLLLPALLSKEDVGLTLALFGVYAAIKWKARWFGLTWLLVGAGWSAVAMTVVLPHFRGGAGSDTWKRFAWLLSPDSIAVPQLALFAVHGALMLFATLAFVPLLSVEFLIGLIVYGYSFTSFATLWMANPGYQSLVPAIPFVFLSLIHGLKRLHARPARIAPFTLAMGLLTLALTEFGMRRAGLPTNAWIWVQAAFLVATAGALLVARAKLLNPDAWIVVPIAGFIAYNPFTCIMFPAEGSIFHHPSPVRLADVRAARERIPPDASVATASSFAPHLSSRRILYPMLDALECEYVVYSPADQRMPDGHVITAAANVRWGDIGYEKVFEQNSLVVWKKPSHFVPADVPVYSTIRPTTVDTDLARHFESIGRLEQAIAYSQAVLTLKPDDDAATATLARLLRKAGRPTDAINVYRELIERLDDAGQRARARNGLALALWDAGRREESAAAFRDVLRDDPTLVAAHQNFGNVLMQMRRYGEAIAVLREGVRRSPDDPVMLNALAWLLATAPDAKDRNGAEAERVARALCERTSHRDARALSTLAAALAELGRSDEAVQAADAAREAALAQQDAALARQIEQMQALYRTGRAYRQPP